MNLPMSPTEAEEIVLTALRNLNEELPEDRRVAVDIHTVLFGVDADLDSLSLVSIVVDVESALMDRGLDIPLADEEAMARPDLPFRTVETLRDYIVQRAGGQ